MACKSIVNIIMKEGYKGDAKAEESILTMITPRILYSAFRQKNTLISLQFQEDNSDPILTIIRPNIKHIQEGYYCQLLNVLEKYKGIVRVLPRTTSQIPFPMVTPEVSIHHREVKFTASFLQPQIRIISYCYVNLNLEITKEKLLRLTLYP